MKKKENRYYRCPVEGWARDDPAVGGFFAWEKTVDFLLSGLLTCCHVSGAFLEFARLPG